MKKILLGSGLLLAATAAAAQVAPMQPRDGVQTRAEAVERTRTMFARIDANRDGFITMAEAQAMRGQARGMRMNRAERRMDPARRAQAFERLDANRDNVISRDEWARAQEARSQRMAQRGQAGMQRMRGQGRMGGGMMLRMADADRDQRVSLQEATNAALQRFDRIDLNRDGRVTVQERQQVREIMRLRRTEGVREGARPVR